MSKTPTIVLTRRRGGKWIRVHADGRETPLEGSRTDWRRVDAMTDAEIIAAARSDPDNPPRQDYRPGRLERVPQVKVVRRALGLTQEQFAATFRLPLGTLRDWEQGKSTPDQAARAYLTAIARNPDAVLDALKPLA